jgi:hypothetical protein
MTILKNTSRVWFSLGLLLLTACHANWMAHFEPKEEGAYARARTADLMEGSLAPLVAAIDPLAQVSPQEAQSALQQVHAVLTDEGRDTVLKSMVLRQVATQTSVVNGDSSSKASLTYLCDLNPSGRQVLINWVIVKHNDHFSIGGVHVTPVEKETGGDLVLSIFLASLVPLICLVSFIACLRTPMASRKRKVGWALLTWVSLTATSYHSTGGVSGENMGVALLGTLAFGANGYHVAFPVGALAFWLRRRHLKVQPSLVRPPENVGDKT